MRIGRKAAKGIVNQGHIRLGVCNQCWKFLSSHFRHSISPTVLFHSKFGRPRQLLPTAMSKHTGTSIVMVWALHCWEESCEDFTTTKSISTSLDLFDAFGINSSDRLSTHAYRAKCALARQVRHTKSFPSQGNTSFACVRLTSPSVEPQPEFNLDLPLMSSSTVIPVSTFSTLTSALTAGAHVVDYRACSPSFSAALPAASAVYLHNSPTRDQLSTFSTLHGAVDSE